MTVNEDAQQTGISKKINFKTKFFLAFPAMPVSLSNVLIHNAYIKYYTDMVGLDPRYVGYVYLIFSIWNAINDPLMGVFIDRFRFRPGKGKLVYIMRLSAPVTVLASLAMVYAQPAWPEWMIFAYLLALLFFFDTTQTSYSIAYASYKLVAAPTNEERVDVSVIGTYIANIGGFLGTLIPTLLLVGEGDRKLTVILFTVVMIINGILYWLALRPLKDRAEMYAHEAQTSEGELAQQLKLYTREAFTSRAFMTYVAYNLIGRGPIGIYFTPFLYLMDHVLRLNGTQATIVDVVPGLMLFAAAPLIGKLSKRTGAKKATLYGAIPAALGFLSLYFVQNMWQALLTYGVIIVFSNFGSIPSQAMMGAIIDEDEQRTGVRKAGLYNGLMALLTIPVGGIQAMIFTAILSAYAFTAGAEQQSAQAILGIRIGASIIPFVFVLLGMIPLALSPISLKRERELSDFSERQHRMSADAVMGD